MASPPQLHLMVVCILNCLAMDTAPHPGLWEGVAARVLEAAQQGLGWGLEDFAMWLYREFGAGTRGGISRGGISWHRMALIHPPPLSLALAPLTTSLTTTLTTPHH